jgi:hypothetical protein
VGQKSVSVFLYRNRFKVGEWILTVAGGDIPSLRDYLRGQKPVVDKEELMLVSREIHALLASAAGISNIKWYFETFRRQGRSAVWTPDELPWAET